MPWLPGGDACVAHAAGCIGMKKAGLGPLSRDRNESTDY
jgi:hypothetical protein